MRSWLHHFISQSPWTAEDLEKRRLNIILTVERLKEGDKYRTKPELGAELVKELKEMGFKIKRVLADSLYVEQGFRNSKNELGWADFRLTNYLDIQTWWELGMCAYLMICLHNTTFNPSVSPVRDLYQQHSLWDSGSCWKNTLNNLQLILQPFLSFNLIIRWLQVFSVPQLSFGFPRLITKINEFDCLKYLVHCWDEF